MSLIEYKKTFYINSGNRISGTNSRFTVNIPILPTDEFDHVSLLQATIPKSFYQVRNTLNTFTLTEGAQNVTITVPRGNYSRRSLQSTLANLLTSNSPNGIVYQLLWPDSSSTQTGKFTFTCSNVGGIQPIFTFGNGMYKQMGFEKNSSNQFVDFQLESVNVINLQPDSLLFIHSDICSNNNANDDILQEIYVAAGTPDYANIHWENYDIESYSKTLVSKAKTTYTFYITDEDGIEVNLNGVHVNLTLVFYKKNVYYDMMKNYIKYILHKEDELIGEAKAQNVQASYIQ
jgi:hypothetical protein